MTNESPGFYALVAARWEAQAEADRLLKANAELARKTGIERSKVQELRDRIQVKRELRAKKIAGYQGNTEGWVLGPVTIFDWFLMEIDALLMEASEASEGDVFDNAYDR